MLSAAAHGVSEVSGAATTSALNGVSLHLSIAKTMKINLVLLSVGWVFVAESFRLFRTNLPWYDLHHHRPHRESFRKRLFVISDCRRGKEFLQSKPLFAEHCSPHKVRYFEEVPVTLYRATNNFVKFEAIPPGTHRQHIQCICIDPNERVPLNKLGTCGA